MLHFASYNYDSRRHPKSEKLAKTLLLWTVGENVSLPTLPATFVNNATALDINFSIPTPVASTTYQEFMTIANSGTSGLSGGAWSGGIVSGVSTFSARPLLVLGVKKEVI